MSRDAKAFGKFVGNDESVDLKPGFQPCKVVIRSVNGTATWHEGMPGFHKDVDGGNPSFLAGSTVELIDAGVRITSDDATLNEDGVSYYYELY